MASAPLTFDDPALERAWWAWFAAERNRVMRGGVAVLLGGVLLFAPIDWLLYPSEAVTLLVIRVVTAGFILLAAPAFFGADSSRQLARHGQEWLFYVCAIAFLGMGLVGWVIAPVEADERQFAPMLALAVLLSGLYGVTGMRVAYAAPLGIGMSVIFGVLAMLRLSPAPEGFLVALTTFLPGANVLGVVMSYTMEQEARRAFLRSRALEAEGRRADELLLNVMPRTFADRLTRSSGTCLDRLPDASVLFATLVGFEAATAGKDPIAAVALLDRIVATFDGLAAQMGVERVKNIGATSMMAAGVTARRADHAEAAVRLALAMRTSVRELAQKEGLAVSLRIGVASGPLTVGVIGRTRHAFDCWGDTVNTAARLDTFGEPDRIQLNAAAVARLGMAVGVVRRGSIPIKGKGTIDTWWVT